MLEAKQNPKFPSESCICLSHHWGGVGPSFRAPSPIDISDESLHGCGTPSADPVCAAYVETDAILVIVILAASALMSGAVIFKRAEERGVLWF